MPPDSARAPLSARARPYLNQLSQRIYQFQNWFFRGRYLLLARLLGLRPIGDAQSPDATLFIEIDGLSHATLQRAVQLGYMPFTRRLLGRGGYRLHRWRCGVAADTPPIQSGLMYGTSEGVVGFYWWDRKTQRRVVGANPYHMRGVQAQLAERARAAGNSGLLEGGSSYSNIMSGGAEFSVLTIAGGGISGASRHWFTPGQGLMRSLSILLLNPGKVARFLFDSAWELTQEMEDRVFVNATDRPRILEGAFPIVRILLNVLAREIITAGTRTDMLRGVPVIYTCYIGYDVLAHHSGPLSRNALRVLRGIDGAIRKLYMTRAWTERRYRLCLLSDHGMTPCQPVEEAFETPFDTWVGDWWRHGAQATPAYRGHRRRVRRWLRRRVRSDGGSWMGHLAGQVLRRNSGWLRTWGRIGAWTLELGSAGAIKLGEQFLEEDVSSAVTPRAAVINCGPLSQIWVKEVDRRLDLREIEEICPGFLDALVQHPAVAVVVGREDEKIVARSARGVAYLHLLPNGPDDLKGDLRSAVEHIEGENPFDGFEEPDVAAAQVAGFASMDACGDVICLAALFTPQSLHDATPGAAGRTHVYAFESQLGTHASIGGDQSYPFVIFPSWFPFDGQPIISATQMYPVLKSFLQRAIGFQPGGNAARI